MADSDIDIGWDYIANQQPDAAVASLFGDPDGDPKVAAKSVQLAADTGTPAPVIYADPERFQREQMAKWSSEIVRENPHLQAFLTDDGMAGKIAKNDLAQLDVASQKIGVLNKARSVLAFPRETAEKVAPAMWHGLQEGFGDKPMLEWTQDPAIKNLNPASQAAWTLLGYPVEAVFRTLSAGMKAVTEGARVTSEELYNAVTGDPVEAKRFGRDIAGATEAEIMGLSGRGHTAKPPGAKGPTKGEVEATQDARWDFREKLDQIKAWVDAGEEPPPGVSPFIDKIRANQSREGVKALDEAYKESQATETRELSPETYRNFVRQHESANVEINGDAIRKLYGDKLPEAEDGVLGHIPNIKDQLDTAIATGGDVTIPMADWLTLEPDVAKALREDVRVRPGALTLTEIKDKAFEAPEREGIPDVPEGHVRFYHGHFTEAQPTTGGGRWVTTDPVYARDFRSEGMPKDVSYVDVPKDHPAEISARRWDEIDEQAGTNAVGTYRHTELPEELAMKMKPFSFGGEKMPPLDEPLPQVRAASGLEPMFSIGDRKIALERKQPKAGSQFGPEQGFHDFDILDQDGKPVGQINLSTQKGGKELYIDMINAGANSKMYDPNFLGPALMRDILRQLKTEFPEAETVTGHRVSGAREKAGTFNDPHAMLVLPLRMESAEPFRELLSRVVGQRVELEPGIEAWFRKPEDWQAHEAEIADAIQSELARIAPQSTSRVVDAIEEPGRGTSTQAMVLPDRKDPAKDLSIFTLASRDPLGDVHHEAIHLLRRGFFTNAEWETLKAAALENNWHGKFQIERFYSDRHPDLQLEEAVAEGFRDWMKNKDVKLEPAAQGVFERLKAFFERVRERIASILGREFTWEEIFQKVDEGEIGLREQGRGFAGTEAMRSEGPKQGELDVTRAEDKEPFRPGAMTPAMTAQMQKRYMDLIAKRHEQDVEAATARAERFQKAQQTQAWKRDREEMRVGVEQEINNRPDVAADLFFSRGELYGERLGGRPKIDPTSLDADLRDRLKATDWLRSDGMDAHDAASMFGFRTPEEMFNALAEYQAQRPEGIGAKRQRDALVERETDRQMELRYGRLDDNIIAEAREQAASETQMQLLHEETYFLATQANAEFSITRSQMRQWSEEQFGKATFADTNSAKWFQTSGKLGRQAEEALLKGDAATAFTAKQQQYRAMSMAQQAIKLEKEKRQFEKSVAKFQKREVKGIDREFTDFIQEMMLGSNIPLRVTRDEVQASKLFHGNASLKDFVEDGLGRGWGLDAEISPEIQFAQFKDIKTMSINDFRDLKDAVDSLAFVGRRTNQIFAQGRLADKKAVVDSIIENLLDRPKLDPDKPEGNIAKILATTKRPEQIIKDLDDHAELGPAFRNLWEPMTVSSAKFLELEKDLTTKVQKMTSGNKAWMKSLSEEVPNDFFYDPHDGALFNLNRGHLVRIMLNWGNEGNIKKFVEGWAAYDKPTKEQVADFRQRMEELIQRNTRPEDWQYVRDVWDIFADWQGQLDTVHRNTSGKLPKWVRPDSIKLSDGSTISEGGYFPLIPDKTRVIPGTGFDPLPNIKNGVMQRDYFRPTTTKSHMMDRQINAKYRVGFLGDMGEVALRMQQVMHDISYRESMMDVSGLLGDKRLRNAIKERYSPEYLKQLDAWLVRQANHLNYDEISMAGMNNVLQRVRGNLVSYALPLNLNVIFSPSVGAIGPKTIAGWTRSLWDYDSMYKVAEENSRVVPHTEYNLDRDFRERIESLEKRHGWDKLRTEAVKKAYWPMIWLEQRLRTVTFNIEFNDGIARGLSKYDASQIADSAVRERHGAQTLTDLPTLMASNEGYKMMTVFMGWFNTMDNWSRQIPGQVRRQEYMKAMETSWGSVIIPAAMGALIFNKMKEDDSYWKMALKAFGLQLTQGIPFAREAASMVVEGYKPTTPLGSVLDAMYQTAKDAKKVWDRKPQGNTIKHVAGAAGMGLGIPGTLQAGKTGQFMYDYKTGKQRPRDLWEWMRGIRTGEARLKKGS